MKDGNVLKLAAIISGLVIIETAIVAGVNGALYLLGGLLIGGGAGIPVKLILERMGKG